MNAHTAMIPRALAGRALVVEVHEMAQWDYRGGIFSGCDSSGQPLSFGVGHDEAHALLDTLLAEGAGVPWPVEFWQIL